MPSYTAAGRDMPLTPNLASLDATWKVRHSADFSGMDEELAMNDLRLRIEHYEKTYQTVREAEGAYIKVRARGANAPPAHLVHKANAQR